MTENKLETLIANIDVRHAKGALIISIYNLEHLKEVLKVQSSSNGQFPFLEIGNKLEIEGHKYIVKNIAFRIQEFSSKTGTTPGANMYAENYSPGTNLNIRVSVDTVE